MPIYEYLCEACGTLSERLQKVTDPPPRKCAECGSRKIARLVSRTSFKLKGGGWFADLYATPRKGGPGKADGSASHEGTAKKTGGEAAAASGAPAPKTLPSQGRRSGNGE